MRDAVLVTKLANGLTLVVEELPYAESASYQLLVPGGLIADADGEEGLCLILADILARGAGGLDARELENCYESQGIVHNEGAALDRFFLGGGALASKLPESLRLLSLLVLEPQLPEHEISSLQQILLQELKSLSDNPARRSLIEVASRYYPHPFGRSPYGQELGIMSTKSSNLLAAWQRLFRPEGAVLSVAGNVNANDVVNLVSDLFARWQGSSATLPQYGSLPSSGIFHLQEQAAQLQIAFMYPAAWANAPHYYTAKVANGILTNAAMCGRLFVEVREKRGLCYSVFSRHVANRYAGAVTVYAATTPERAHETYEVALNVLRDLRGSASDGEVAAAKANFKAELVIGQEASGARAIANAEDMWVFGRIRPLVEIETAINDVTSESIDQYLDAFPPKPHAVLTLGARSL